MKHSKTMYLLTMILVYAMFSGGGNTQAQNFVFIYNIQGNTTTSPYAQNEIITEGVVTGVFPGLNGCLIQDPTGDANPNTSDGIWVAGVTEYSIGTKISINATVRENYGQTELFRAKSISVMGTGFQIFPVAVRLPDDLEKYEGMLVAFKQTLTVTENYNLNRYGELTLSAYGRLVQPTEYIDPNDRTASGVNNSGISNVSSVITAQTKNNNRSVVIDDGSSKQNQPTNPYWDRNYNCRIGSKVKALTGCISYSYSSYRILPTHKVSIKYAPRPKGLSGLGSYNLKVATFNVLNYFNGDGAGNGFPTSRGASTFTEFVRQRDKIVAAMRMIDADVLGLMELENDGSGPLSAIADLTHALNTAYGCEIYTYIPDPTLIGTDEIKCGIIYKKIAVTPLDVALSDSDPIHDRPPVAQSFVMNTNRQRFTFIVNHLKSKGATGATGADTDQNDGQGCFNETRRRQAKAVIKFAAAIATATGISNQIILGDWNSYNQEDPVDIMRAAGYIPLLEGAYSYVYSGQSGAIDHIFVSSALIKKLTGAQVLHINADEPRHLDYNTEFNPESAYQPNAYRSSDHDPKVAAFRIGYQRHGVSARRFQ